MKARHTEGDEGNVAVAERNSAGEPRSERGKRERLMTVLRPMDQIRMPPGNDRIQGTGAWAYYLRPDGATIRDALVLYPNGGVPDLDDARMKSRYSTNAEYYRQRQANKGIEYIGPTLTDGGIRRLVEVLDRNRAEEILFIEDEIEDAQSVTKEADRPEIRDQARKRTRQLATRLGVLNQPLDAEALESELKEIAQAQQLAKVDPAVLRVMRAMIGDVNERVETMVSHFQGGKPIASGDAAPKLTRTGANSNGAEFEGEESLDRD